MHHWIERHPVTCFYVSAYFYSWMIAVPLALQAQGVIQERWPFWLHYLSAFSPALAALSIRRLLAPRSVRDRSATGRQGADISLGWLAIGALSPLAMFAIAQIAGGLWLQTTPSWTALGRVNFLPPLGLWAWGLWFLTSGVGEELGWRGFALPRLQRTHSALASSALLSVAWAGWHLPAFFYIPSYAAIGLWILPGFFVGILAGSIVLAWLYNSGGGSILAVILWHASFNFVSASPNAAGFSAAVVSTLVILWAAGAVLSSGPTLTARSVRATSLERTQPLPGDEVIPRSIEALTHAITIRCSREELWPWLVQMGADRAGWYSYDFIDNGRRPSADRILPEFQQPDIGTVFPALPGVKDAFVLVASDPGHWLILGWPSQDCGYIVSWAFVLRQVDPTHTRLIVRARGAETYPFYGLPRPIGSVLIRIGHFIMQRKQLMGIARRAEHAVGLETGLKTATAA